MPVKRYSFVNAILSGEAVREANDKGNYVLYEDYEKLKKRINQIHDMMQYLHVELFPEGRIA